MEKMPANRDWQNRPRVMTVLGQVMLSPVTHIASKIPEAAFYIPNFISDVDEHEILQKVYSVPLPKWTCLSNRRLQNWGGVPHSKGMIAEPIPEWLSRLMHATVTAGAFPADKAPNHVLINEYLPGQGIMPHFDGPLFYPTIATITCGSHGLLNFHQPNDKEICHSLLLERKSLVVLQKDLYHDHQHSIAEDSHDEVHSKVANLERCNGDIVVGKTLERGTRVSLTIRHVPSTSKFKLKFSR